MPRFNQIKNNFTSGEVSPRVFGRTDLETYNRSLKELRNMIVYPQGGASRRPGSQFILDDFKTDTTLRLIPFTVSESLIYVLILTDDVSSFGQILKATDNTLHAITLDGILATHFSAAQLPDIKFTQSGSTLILTHPLQKTVYLYSTGTVDDFEASTLLDAGNDILAGQDEWETFPYKINVNAAHTMTLSSVFLGAATLTSSVAFFKSGHDQSLWQVEDGYFRATGFTSSTQLAGTVVKAITTIASGTPTGIWSEGYWSDARGWPRVATFHQQRLIYAGSTDFPDTVWVSKAGDIREFDQTLGSGDNDAFVFLLASDKVDLIQWLSPAKRLNIGTLNKEYIAGDSNGVFNANNPFISPETTHGSAYVQPVRAQESPVFVSRSKTRLREFTFNFNEDNYRSADLSLQAEHIFTRGRDQHATFNNPQVKFLDYQENENSLIWVLDNNGAIYSVTRDRQNNLLAFAHHIIGGALSGEAPKVESVAIVPTADNTSDEVWIVVVRTIDGSTARYIEKIGREFKRDDLTNASTSIDDKPVYSDSAKLVILGGPGKTFSGFDHLEGETVDVLADGLSVGQKVVTSGDVVLNNNATEIVAGLNYRSLIQPLNVEAGSALGNSKGSIKRVHRIGFEFYRTVGAKFGKDETDLEDINFRPTDLDLDQPIPLFTGLKELDYPQGYEKEVSPVAVQDLPLPMALNSLIWEGVTND